MASLKEIRNRISSVQSTKQITSAMKMVSAARLRKAQDSILKMRPYANKLHSILVNLSDSLEGDTENVYTTQRPVKKVLIVVATSNRGLCGAFNSNLIKKALEVAKVKHSNAFESGNVYFWCFGKKASEFFHSKGYRVLDSDNTIFDHLTYEEVAKYAEHFMSLFASEDFDHIEVIYNQFKNAAVQILTEEQFLPVKVESNESNRKKDYIFEPSKDYIIKEIIPKTLKIQLFKILLDSNASEHGARMTAMHKATDNATELIRDLRLNYNKARQASITNEILEIVTGANALKS